MTLDSGIDAQFSPELERLLEETYLTREIFVVCKNQSEAYKLMEDFLRIVKLPDSARVFKDRYMIVTRYETARFITREQLDIICKGRHRTEVVWDFEFRQGLNRYLKQQAKGETK
jgi:hypothetical protein